LFFPLESAASGFECRRLLGPAEASFVTASTADLHFSRARLPTLKVAPQDRSAMIAHPTGEAT